MRLNRKKNNLAALRLRLSKSALKGAFLRVWLACHCVFVAGWLLPPASAVGSSVRALGRPYLQLTGVMQWWDLFAPNPVARDVELSARLTYKDGTVKEWWFPRVHTLGYFAGYRQDRWRKLVENVSDNNAASVWPSLAAYAARVNPGPGPVRVELLRSMRLVPGFQQPENQWSTVRLWEGYL